MWKHAFTLTSDCFETGEMNYLNSIVEQNHHPLKQRIEPGPGFFPLRQHGPLYKDSKI